MTTINIITQLITIIIKRKDSSIKTKIINYSNSTKIIILIKTMDILTISITNIKKIKRIIMAINTNNLVTKANSMDYSIDNNTVIKVINLEIVIFTVIKKIMTVFKILKIIDLEIRIME